MQMTNRPMGAPVGAEMQTQREKRLSRAYGAKRFMSLCLMTLLISCSQTQDESATALSYDVLIRDATVIDGSGNAGYQADVGIKEGKIALIGNAGAVKAETVIDAKGLVLTPGFIDTHSHSGSFPDDHPDYLNSANLLQGVTTIVEGPDGSMSPAQMKDFIADLTTHGFGTNYALYVGHNGIREAVMGHAQRAATPAELEQMKAMVRQGMDMGAVGLSAGLMYDPGMFSDKQEIIDLAKEVAPYGGIFDSHSRDPVFHLLESEGETIAIGAAAGIPAKLGHLKAVGLINKGKTDDLIRMIETARAKGQTVVSDQYPYDGAATALLADILLFPGTENAITRFRDHSQTAKILAETPDLSVIRKNTEHGINDGFSWVKAVGYGSMRIVYAPNRPELVGQNLELLAKARGLSPFDLVVDLVKTEKPPIIITLGLIEESEVQELLVQPWNMICSDGAHVTPDGRSVTRHPRSTGSFARVIQHYVGDLKLLTLPEAIRKMTSLPAGFLNLDDRGLIKTGNAADIALFDPAKLKAQSTWADPHAYATGMAYVFVNGVMAVKDSRTTGAKPGTFVKRQSKSNQ